jgi:glycosyltransferase involved in cell wall biosynthesis
MSKTVMIPAYAFPPWNNGGTFRLAKFVKFLPEFGWEPIVVAPAWDQENSQGAIDSSIALTEKCEVIRVPFVRPPISQRQSLLAKVCAMFSANEPAFGRLPADMLAVCQSIARERKIDAVFASSLPRFLHAIASRLHKEFEMPWIADHRDIVDQEGSDAKCSIKQKIILKRSLMLEAKFTRNAAAVTTVSAPLAARLRLRNRAPVYEIMNGFDPNDFSAIQPTRPYDGIFRIVYCGSFFGQRDPAVFLDGLDMLCAMRQDLASHVQAWFYGKCASKIANYLSGRLCSALVHVGGEVPHKVALQREAEAQVLYLISHPSKGIVTGKIFEYLYVGVPVLSVPGDGDITDRILQETGGGIICRTREDVCRQLILWLSDWKACGSIASTLKRDAVEVYSRRRQTEQLAKLLNPIISS